MPTYYAWSPIGVGTKNSVAFGDEVTETKLGVDKENWNALIEAGSVRTTKPPKMENFSGSVVEFYQREAKNAALDAGATADEANLKAQNAVREVG